MPDTNALSPRANCRDCAEPIPSSRPDHLCSKCLLALALTELEVATEDSGAGGPSVTPPFPAGGQRLAGYELLAPVGEGGVGVVFKAKQLSLGRVVAVKILRSGPWAAEGEIRRFQSEARLAAGLLHRNIVSVHETGVAGGHHFLVMDFVEGSSLAQMIQRGALSTGQAAQVVRTIAEAMQYAHERGVLHRDLKPANILIDGAGQPRVTDFGLARPVARASEFTASGAVLGTPGYMPPEQALGRRREIGPSSDVYSLGATLYECLTGRAPFRAESPLDTLRQVIESDPLPPRWLNPKVPADLETICLKCLAKPLAGRYASARELADDLGRFQRGAPIVARPLGLANRAWRWARRNPVVAGLVSGVLLLLLLLAAAAFLSRRDAEEGIGPAAVMAANTISMELQKLGRPVESLAASAGLTEVLRQTNAAALTNWLAAAYRSLRNAAGAPMFENLVVMGRDGENLGRWPSALPERALSTRASRDYFRGPAQRVQAGGRDEVYFSRLYRSAEDDLYKIGVSQVIRAPTGEWLAVLSAMVGTKSTETLFGLTTFNRKTVLAGHQDPATAVSSGPHASEFLIFWHPGFPANASAVPLRHRFLSELASSTNSFRFDSDYRDPVASRNPRYLGRWLAGFARVPGTSYVVIYQTRDRVTDALLTAATVLGTGGLVLLTVWGVHRRRATRAMKEDADEPEAPPTRPSGPAGTAVMD